jgi:CRISPR type I-F-associated protein Csy2
MPTIYVVFKDMQVINCNLSSSYLTADLSQNAYMGFAHNLARHLKEALPENKTLSLGKEYVFSIIKYLEFNQGYASLAGHLNDNNHKALNIPMNPPEIKGTLRHTVVIELDSEVSHNNERLLPAIQRFALHNRFAGGDISPLKPKQIEIHGDPEALQNCLTTEKGWLIQDATAELVEQAQRIDYSHAFNDFLATFSSLDDKGKKQYQRRHKGWYFASLAGYQLLEAPKQRTGARYDLAHAFAEPIIGLHQLVYYRQQPLDDLFWFNKQIDHTFLITQTL